MTGHFRHLMIYVADIGRSKAFYDKVLGHLKYSLVHGSDTYAMWAPEGGGCAFAISQGPLDKRSQTHDRGAPGWHHLAFNADSREIIDRLHADVLVPQAASILDAPTECPEYSETYYACYFEDPDGLKLEVATS
ncbi:MAG: bleomycin resistance protein [Gemmatimonadetes bacterium]|jgi:glyoxylase I family protein|nr:bleomycin resistance protein [Gemmatimonadota bacterium]MBT7860622.1 bleomycin resistance protein [Gemmatimonadota bacterium]